MNQRDMNKTLGEYAKEWQSNAEGDPLWVILTDSQYYGRKWNVDEFFVTGEDEVGRVFRFMDRESIIAPSGSFLDFGCGVGRISKALRKRFESGFGVDISPKMIELAQAYVKDVKFVVNQADSLSQFADDSIDFIYSHIVLQHIPNSFQKRYMDEFLRILRPGGLAVFQVPVDIINERVITPPFFHRIKQRVKRMLPFLVTIKRKLIPPESFHHEFRYEMHILHHEDIQKICEERKCIIEAVPATNSCERDHNGKVEFYEPAGRRKRLVDSGLSNRYLSYMYFVRKP
ncbi:MAG: class I SAM-dependent methyltransferase [Dissulfurispiraceae bacterium]